MIVFCQDVAESYPAADGPFKVTLLYVLDRSTIFTNSNISIRMNLFQGTLKSLSSKSTVHQKMKVLFSVLLCKQYKTQKRLPFLQLRFQVSVIIDNLTKICIQTSIKNYILNCSHMCVIVSSHCSEMP
jgi:hypothetical protein